MEQDVLASIDIFFCLFILAFTSWYITIYSQCRMGACRRVDRLQSRIESFQVLPGRSIDIQIVVCLGLTFFVLCADTRFIKDRATGNELLGTILFCTRCFRIRYLTSTKSCAPGIFVGSFSFIRGFGFLDGFAIVTNGIGLQIGTDIRCVGLGIGSQLFHDDRIMSLFSLSDFDETIVPFRGIRIFCNGWSLGIVIRCAISILYNISVGIFVCTLLPGHGVPGYIALVMTEGNRTILICSSLIADRGTIFCSNY